MANPGGPLAGIKVLDVAGMIAAPSACAMMADLGADVIKVEPPQGDLLRGLVTVPEGPDPWWELCLLYTSPSPRDLSTSRMPSSA